MNSSYALANSRLLLKNYIAVHLSFQRSNYRLLAFRDCERTQGEKAFLYSFFYLNLVNWHLLKQGFLAQTTKQETLSRQSKSYAVLP